MSYPADWAVRGDGQTKVNAHPLQGMSLGFRKYIEGPIYDRTVQVIPVENEPEGERLGRVIHPQSFPSGGYVEYASYAYTRDGENWVYGGEGRFKESDPLRIEWFEIKVVGEN